MTKKTTKKTSKKEESTKPVEQEKKMPEAKVGDYTFMLNTDEVLSLIQILAFSKDLFMQMSINAATAQDQKGQITYAARSELSAMLYSKFREIASIGEPSSRELH